VRVEHQLLKPYIRGAGDVLDISYRCHSQRNDRTRMVLSLSQCVDENPWPVWNRTYLKVPSFLISKARLESVASFRYAGLIIILTKPGEFHRLTKRLGSFKEFT
jgi:hypothetical protein